VAHGCVSRPAHIHACGNAGVARSPAATLRDAATITTCRPRAPHRLTRPPCPLQHSIKEARRHFLPHDAMSRLLCSCSVYHRALRSYSRRAAALSHCCLHVRLHVDVDWGPPQAKPTTARSLPDATCSPLPQPHRLRHGQPSPATLRACHHCRELRIRPVLFTGHLVGFLDPLSGLPTLTHSHPRAPPWIVPSVSSHPPRCPKPSLHPTVPL
jgi:hypothetical protein